MVALDGNAIGALLHKVCGTASPPPKQPARHAARPARSPRRSSTYADREP